MLSVSVDLDYFFKGEEPQYVVLRPYRERLRSMMKEENLHTHSPAMKSLVSALLVAVQKGIERDYGQDIALGIAMLNSHFYRDRAVKKVVAKRRVSHGFMEVDEMEECIIFLRKHFIRKSIPRGALRGFLEYRGILNEIRDKWIYLEDVMTLEEAAMAALAGEQV